MVDRPAEETSPIQPSQAEALGDLLSAGHIDQVIERGRQLLQDDPEDAECHLQLALALTMADRAREAGPHVKFLLEKHPVESSTHQAASFYYGGRSDWHRARQHIEEAIRIDPQFGPYHVRAACVYLQMGKFKKAQDFINTARELDPSDPEAIRIDAAIRGFHDSSTRTSWERAAQIEAALSLAPEDPDLYADLGEIYLTELEDAPRAEQLFREALLLRPTDRDIQRQLFRAIGRQRLLYRLLSIPTRTYEWILLLLRGLALRPWYILFLLFGIKFVGAFLIWLMLATILFLPACLCYEWLLISEIRCASESSLHGLRFKRWLNRWPFWVRMSAFLSLNLGFWVGLFLLFNIPLSVGSATIGILIALHFFPMLAWMGIRRIDIALSRRSAKKVRPRLG